VAIACLSASSAVAPVKLLLPGGKGGIGFDDLGFSPTLRRIMVPAGRTGNLDLIDPTSRQITSIGGFAVTSAFAGGHGEGITSVDEGKGYLLVTDRTAKRLYIIDPRRHRALTSAPLAASPDYVRFVAPTDEIWVTEPRARRIEIFSLRAGTVPKPVHAGFIAVRSGPESLVIDRRGGRAFTNSWQGTTMAIGLKQRAITARWSNGCQGARGLALDSVRNLLFTGCAEGKLTVFDLHDGKLRGSVSSGNGVDIIAYNSQLRHVYVPGADSATMTIVGISPAGKPSVLATVKTASGAHCVISDDADEIYVCAPAAGSLLIYQDSFPTAR